MDWLGKSTSRATQRSSMQDWLTIGATCTMLLLAAPAARADDDASKPAPRTALQIGGASIVLIAANDQLYAFVDQVEDNAPVADAELAVETIDGAALPMTRSTDGLFVAPFQHAGRMHDAFRVTLRAAVATGSVQADIAYDDLPRGSGSGHSAFGSPVAIALVSGAIGAVASAMVMLWWRGARRRAAAAPVGTVQAA